MSSIENILQEIIQSEEQKNYRAWQRFFHAKDPDLTTFKRYTNPDERANHDSHREEFPLSVILGRMDFPDDEVVVVHVPVNGELTEKTSKRRQYVVAKEVLKSETAEAGIFIFTDTNGRFRMSLVFEYLERGQKKFKQKFSNYRRYTFFVDPQSENKTFFNQLRYADFSSLIGIQHAFSLSAVTDDFYKEFRPKFDQLVQAIAGDVSSEEKQDFALLFTIRVIFLGFVQKRKWIGEDTNFLWNFYQEYKGSDSPKETFYTEWLKPLFFDSLNAPQGRKVKWGENSFSAETERALQMTPYLNSELFSEKNLDKKGLSISDA